MPTDFISLGNIIFKDKDKYKFVTDEDKEKNFFILNRKFAYKNLKIAQFLNNKNIEKSSSIDIWFNIFSSYTNIPTWYWQTKLKKSTTIKSQIKGIDLEDVKVRYDLTDSDINFLILYYEKELESTIKRLKKFEKK